MAKGRNLFILLLTTLAIALAILGVSVFKKPSVVDSAKGSSSLSQPKASLQKPEGSRPHLTPRARATEELKTSAMIQNQLQVLTYLLDQGQEDEFLMRLNKEIRTHPDVVEYRALLADFYYLKENWEGAEAALNEVLRLAPENNYAQTTLGEIVGIQGRYQEGLDHLSQVLDREPSNLEALYGTLSISDLQGSPEVGIQKITELYRSNPNSGNIAVVYADVLLSQGRRNERRDILARAMKSDPQNPAPYRMAAMDALREGDNDEAIRLSEESISLDENADTKAQTVEVIFESAVSKKDFRKALEAIQKGEALQPWNEAWAIRRQQLDDLSQRKN